MSLFTKPKPKADPDAIVPPNTMPLRSIEPQIPRSERQKVIREVFDYCALGGPRGLVSRWIMKREVAYFNGPAKSWRITGQRDDVVEYAACRDFLAWKSSNK